VRSLRARLALACGAAVVIVVLVAGALLVSAASSDQYRELDESLNRRIEAVRIPAQRVIQRGDAGILRVAATVMDDLVVRVQDGDRLLFDTGDVAADPWPAIPEGTATIDSHGRSWRTLRQPIQTPTGSGHHYTVMVALPLGPTRETVANLQRNVALIGLLAIAIAAAAGWLLGTWVLRPLARVRRAAAEVAATTDLASRVDPGRAPPELATVVAALNGMLAQLETASIQERRALETSRSFSANVTHELRSPLTSLSTNLDILRRHPALTIDERDDLIADAQNAAARAAELLMNLEVLARGEVRDALDETVDLSEVVDAAVAAARSRHPGAVITVVEPDAATTVTGWSEGLRLLVDNLLTNAVVHGRREAEPVQVRVALAPGDGGLGLLVDDDGPGIPADSRDLMRQPFIRGPAQSPGSGLGLAIVDQQVRLHHATFELTDCPDGGTRARVVFPRWSA
jgi:two-component system sensor histidine kinase PrrB